MENIHTSHALTTLTKSTYPTYPNVCMYVCMYVCKPQRFLLRLLRKWLDRLAEVWGSASRVADFVYAVAMICMETDRTGRGGPEGKGRDGG